MWTIGPGGPRPRGGPSQAVQLLEVAVFLLLVLPSLVLALFVSPGAATGTVDFPSLAIAIIVRDISLVALIAFFLWKNGETRCVPPFARLGWDLRDAPKEIAIGIALFLPMTISASIVAAILRAAGLSGPSERATALEPHGGAEIGLALLLVIVVAVAEETLFRGYLMLRFRNLTGSLPLAIVASSLVFAIGHGYQGASGLIAVGVIGFELALVYAWRRTLVAPITMHFLQDFIGLVLVPFLSSVHR